MNSIFVEISALLAIAVAISFVVRLLKQPLIVAYIIAGIVCGPFVLNLLHGGGEMYDSFAEFGVVLLLFIIGLNLNFTRLKSIGKVSFITGIGQVVFTGVVGTVILLAAKFHLVSAAYLAVAITFSSTIIIMKLLTDKHDSDTIYGRYTIGLMLVQDIIALTLIVALGVLKQAHAANASIIIIVLLKFIMAAAILSFVSKYILPKVLDKIADSSELLFLFALAWCFGAASFLYLLGFSLEIGAVMAGVALSASPYQLEIGSRVKPLRDFFLIVFFIVLGSELGIASIGAVIAPAFALSVFILIGNPVILYFLFRAFRFTRRNSFLAGLTAAQVSEFGFVLLYAGRQFGHLQGEEVAIFTGVAIITIFASSYLITYNERIYRFLLPFFRLFGPDKHRQIERMPKHYEAWIVGYHRIGVKVAETLSLRSARFAVVDFDPKAVAQLRRAKIPFYFGDVADIEFLECLTIAQTKTIVMTIPAVDDQINLIQFARRRNKKVLIICNAYHREDAETLYAEGADFVMMPHFLGGQWISKVLSNRRFNKKSLAEMRREQADLICG